MVIPKDERQNTSVKVGATASLRQLGVDASERIMQAESLPMEMFCCLWYFLLSYSLSHSIEISVEIRNQVEKESTTTSTEAMKREVTDLVLPLKDLEKSDDKDDNHNDIVSLIILF
ncbi:hypothetical protein Ccrd_010427 [Cynara cardunculus var. scolymus]|uniref:Uncharacterized protein n=1 Tax=Cynara cardunculus var. scolymus TaxID=59895 RepID=A0A103YL69_CYNCS|nr:hypothetical protein Ccrd_010427 [Cynara cardunculus var. scolymus]